MGQLAGRYVWGMEMSEPDFFRSAEDFRLGLQDLDRSLDCRVKLPQWPFRAPSGWVRIYEYDRVLGSDFGTVLGALAEEYRDQDLSIVTLDPQMSYFRYEYGFYPGFQVLGHDASERYGHGLRHEPDDDPTGALAYTANVVGISGSSGAWSIWAQRDWEIGLLLTRDRIGTWCDQSVPSFSSDVDLASIRSPRGWGMPLSDSDLAMFWRNIRERGSGLRPM